MSRTPARIANSELTIQSAQQASDAGASPKVCIRAEDLQITAMPTEHPNSWPGTVRVAGFQGNDIRYAIQLESGPELDALGGLRRGEQHKVGDRVWVTVNPNEVQILPAEVLA